MWGGTRANGAAPGTGGQSSGAQRTVADTLSMRACATSPSGATLDRRNHMARKSTGTVLETELRDGSRSFAIRFRVNGRRQYRTLGYDHEGWSRARAEAELADVISDVRRGRWREPEPEPQPTPRFHAFAEQWFETQRLEGGSKGKGLSPAGEADLRWRLEVHLLPYFVKTLKDPRLDEITIEHVDRFRQAKVREGRGGATSINKCLATLSAILEVGLEYGHIDRNPAKGKRRRLRQGTPQRTRLDRADHIAALIAGAAALDARARTHRGQRRALVSLLLFAGLRISEALALQWRDVDLARGEIRVRRSKTDAGVRLIYMEPILRDEIASYRASLRDVDRDGLVFATSTGKRYGATNVRKRIIEKATVLANEEMERRGTEQLPRLTPHSLRRTYATLLCALGREIPFAKSQMGHKTAAMLLDVYAGGVHPDEKQRLAALVRGEEWAVIGQSPIDQHADGARLASRNAVESAIPGA
jgi:integrase